MHGLRQPRKRHFVHEQKNVVVLQLIKRIEHRRTRRLNAVQARDALITLLHYPAKPGQSQRRHSPRYAGARTNQQSTARLSR